MADRSRLLVETEKGAAARVFDGMRGDLAQAAALTMQRAGTLAKSRGRAAIAAGGFGRKWQNALRADVYPKGGRPSLGAAVSIYHKIPYAGIFEKGGVIAGGPLLWLPIPATTPRRLPGNKKVTPANWIKKIGPLAFVKGRRHPLLIRLPKQPKGKGRRGRYAKMFPGLGGAKRIKGVDGVPVFFGVPAVRMRQRFGVIKAIESVGAEVPAIFSSNVARLARGK